MTKKTLLAFELPNADDDGTLVEWSMQSFLQAISFRQGFRFLYRTFTSSGELSKLLSSQAPVSKNESVIAYISSHGAGGRLSSGYGLPDINLRPLASDMSRYIEGIWVAACETGGAKSLEAFLSKGRAVWAGGYTCAIEWDAAIAIDTAIISVAMKKRAVKTRTSAINVLCVALGRFSPEWKVGTRDNKPVSIREAVCLWARDEKQGSAPRDVTKELLEKLRWARE